MSMGLATQVGQFLKFVTQKYLLSFRTAIRVESEILTFLTS